MKRLTLEVFKAKKQPKKVDQLLGQILGDCHNTSTGSSQGGSTPPPAHDI